MKRQINGANKWWEDHNEIARLIEYLHETDGLEMDEAIYLVQKPWKWTEEYDTMCREQRDPCVERENAELEASEDCE
jgi:hypothetical protein